MVSLARRTCSKTFLLQAQAGYVMLAVTIQTGIFNGFTRSAKLIDNSSADIWVASESLVHVDLTCQSPYKPNPGSTGGRRGAGRSANC